MTAIKAVWAVACLALVGCSPAAEVMPKGDPMTGRNSEMRGWLYNADAVVSEGDKFHWAQQVFTGYRKAGDIDLPQRIRAMPADACKFEKPAATDAVHHVFISRGTHRLPIYTIPADDAKTRAENYVETFERTKGNAPVTWNEAEIDAMSVVNVAVTRNDKAVYLVLSSEGKTLWNIQAGPGVQLSRIAIISQGEAGIANAPEGVPVQALAAPGTQHCDVNPKQLPKDDWFFVKNMKEDGSPCSSERELLAKNIQLARDYSSWFYMNFGVSSYDVVAEALGVSNALIGPLPATPEARIPFVPVKDAVVWLTPFDNIVVGANKAYIAKNAEVVRAAAEKLAGRDLKSLLPAT